MDILKKINNSKEIRKLYYQISKNVLDIIVGNELVMQKENQPQYTASK